MKKPWGSLANLNKTIAIYVEKIYNGCYISEVSAFVENSTNQRILAADTIGWYVKSEGGRYYGRE